MKIKETSNFWICCSNGSAIPLYQYPRNKEKEFFVNTEYIKALMGEELKDLEVEKNEIPT